MFSIAATSFCRWLRQRQAVFLCDSDAAGHPPAGGWVQALPKNWGGAGPNEGEAQSVAPRTEGRQRRPRGRGIALIIKRKKNLYGCFGHFHGNSNALSLHVVHHLKNEGAGFIV